MNKESFEFFKAMVETPSVAGFEQPVARIIRKRMQPYADEITTDLHGNTIVALNPKGTPRVMLAGHCDQIGMMVKYITDEGYITFATVGGIDMTVLPGSRVTIHTQDGPVEGVIGRKPTSGPPAARRPKNGSPSPTPSPTSSACSDSETDVSPRRRWTTRSAHSS